MKDSLDRIDFATRRKGGVDSRIVIVCEYSKSGQIVARTANGVRHTYEYDKKGQLLAVKDSDGNAVERYAYDKAGNMLKKTLRIGRGDSPSRPQYQTTTFTFDDANQLVSSTTDGVTTRYAYDAAGRLVREGSKTYRYGYLDKVLSVTDGDTTRTFTYHADGQLATANYVDNAMAGAHASSDIASQCLLRSDDMRTPQSETFLWDGLALIQRGEEQFMNEPHVGGGNPIASSKGTSYFNDALGTTVGSKSNGKYSAAALTAFGEDLTVHSPTPTQNSNFFTGKPYVEGLGHAFLMRNYRAGLAKWQSADPVGYPDGWNAHAYCNNGVTSAIDLWGCAIVTSVVNVGGTTDQPTYGGTTSCAITITDVNVYTYTVSAVITIQVKFCETLEPSAAFGSGAYVEYIPHDGVSNGVLDPCVREAAEAHENGHSSYAINVMCPALRSELELLEIRWKINGWSESQVRLEAQAVAAQLWLNYLIGFCNAANAPTISWFNSAPEWRLVHDAQNDGTWLWVKE